MTRNTWVYRTIVVAYDNRNRKGWIDTSRPAAAAGSMDHILAHYANAGWELVSLNPERLRAITVPIGRYLIEPTSLRAVFRRRDEDAGDG